MSKRVVSVLVALVVLATSCSAATAGNDPDPDRSSTPSSVPLPGTQAFGLTDEEFAAYVEQVESRIAACMAEAGFEYVPVDVTAILEVGVWMRADPSVSREEYKSQWGYGISTRTDNPPREVGLGSRNIQIYESLAESEQIAYDRTLFGDDPDATFALTLDDEDFNGTGGCTREAVASVFPSAMLSSTFVNPKDLLIESDPRVEAAEEAWMDCMGEAGYEYEDQDDIIEEFEERLETLTEGEDLESLGSEDLEALEALKAEEIAVALKDLECQGPLDEVIRTVEIEIYGEPVSG